MSAPDPDYRALLAEVLRTNPLPAGRYDPEAEAALRAAHAAIPAPPVTPPPAASGEGLTLERVDEGFRAWWYDCGSALRPLPGADHEEHGRRIAEIAWTASVGYSLAA
jgi:hypothetical protein